jgi:tRNA-2-methylthio-N6-dimethylallyladenosine synthase
MIKKYYIWTIGCQMNQAESDRLAVYLDNTAYQSTSEVEKADLIILNSCVVRQSAENRVINKLHALKTLKTRNPQLTIALTGCLVGNDNDHLSKKFPFIDHLFTAGEFPVWLGEYNPEKVLRTESQITTCVPIMQGCNNFCTYCIVPYRRGRERSREPENLVCEIGRLVKSGTKEVTLLGQNVDSYGSDLAGQPDLAELLERLRAIEGLVRIRFLTNHPKDMKPRLIEAVAQISQVCKQINLPVQAGDDEILKAMHRGYTVEQYRSLVGEIRAKIPNVALSTDVIVGFPGETDKQFQNTYDLLAELRFDMVHVAAYSPRPGTVAARTLEDSVSPEIKKSRLDGIEDLQSNIAGEINRQLLDKTVEILVEGVKKDRWFGRTGSDKLVFFNARENYTGKLVNIKITRTSPWSLTGKPVLA